MKTTYQKIVFNIFGQFVKMTPPHRYTYISQETWDAKIIRQSARFQDKSSLLYQHHKLEKIATIPDE